MLEKTPTNEEIIMLIGQHRFDIWVKLTELIEMKYDMEKLCNSGGKKWTYEYKYRRGGKTLCCLYAKPDVFGFMLIFGKLDREKIESIRSNLSADICKIYDEAATYHDGKWVMFEISDTSFFSDFEKLLQIKRKPNN
ncbi:conserved hypothetical protein [Alteracholeplasma palmae J233]|uniref:DUF3788 domain-containing protein n=1 Tax=Alteracholeplasma palmae (strain ATCC 49389 / J233) TaxID=1318466 RepID=U4KJY0_ALTPJ|nr:DUF3788 domain-containing protein [Alteracholeplasma palmae]CCV63778.1 conserved hypothetical protein [Alteracholeplasma palmae J233]